MDANIRELKAKLSDVIRKVQGGETVTVSVRNRPVARIVPIASRGGLKERSEERRVGKECRL